MQVTRSLGTKIVTELSSTLPKTTVKTVGTSLLLDDNVIWLKKFKKCFGVGGGGFTAKIQGDRAGRIWSHHRRRTGDQEERTKVPM